MVENIMPLGEFIKFIKEINPPWKENKLIFNNHVDQQYSNDTKLHEIIKYLTDKNKDELYVVCSVLNINGIINIILDEFDKSEPEHEDEYGY